ncbi:hypothetical protein ASPACDRAFT_49133 [Aspergillus aculeatus ATCC 16872]|uniref:Zn(2)-C6 fungal-type domain-containing protein n=1 Tax=Aspergillus aculeatus (strain ATCC 16872 / CBS 172.66 / WB 5094) TaxID=690307 RepID=A0A1L9X8R8_ASPA1|nr:uncharacterized protein ASPACDRAFT_49133 [Aspergillus aculeatus ATCC 16872]OJK04738.1 hypothetical protein ASPACDRAFT_49133 [Aspergillus aculeatus ATCC 16872]
MDMVKEALGILQGEKTETVAGHRVQLKRELHLVYVRCMEYPQTQPNAHLLRRFASSGLHYVPISQQQPAQPRRRRRPALACRECRRRKIKCDHKIPCAQCRRHGTSCLYTAYSFSSHGSPFSSSPNTNASPPPPPSPPPPTTTTTTNAPREALQLPVPPAPDAHVRSASSSTDGPTLHELVHRVQKLEELASTGTRLTNSPTLHAPSDSGIGSSRSHPSPAGTQEWQCVLNKSRDRGSIKIGRPSRGFLPAGLASVPPARETADAMVELYLSTFESAQRILHIPTFRAEYRRYWDEPGDITPTLRRKVLLVIGIGSSLLDISGLQISCLTILARQLFSIGGDTIWISMGSMVHTAMQIGLHRDPRHLPTKSVLESELRRRLWYTILKFVVQASLDSWMPPRISFDEFDTEPPSNFNDNQLNESAAQPLPRERVTETSIQLALIRLLPIRLRIVQLLSGLHSEHSYEQVLALSSELADALQGCNHQSFAAFHRNLLDYLVRRFMIPLHYYFSNQARSNPLFHYSLKLSLDAALALVSPEPDSLFARLMATGGGLFREGIRCATSAISLELLAHAETQRLNDRIRQGETNVKNHMFLRMILAQVEAVETGKAVEIEVARAARDSLELCNTILQTREHGGSMLSPDLTAIAAMEFDGTQGLELGPDFDWESFFPDVASNQWIG